MAVITHVHSNFNFNHGAKTHMESDTDRKERTGLSSLRITDDESKAVQKTPLRISLSYIESRIKPLTEYIHPATAPHMTIAIVHLDNGYLLVGKSVPADPENYDEALGRKFAYEDAVRQAWPLFAFGLREGMSGSDIQDDLETLGFAPQETTGAS